VAADPQPHQRDAAAWVEPRVAAAAISIMISKKEVKTLKTCHIQRRH